MSDLAERLSALKELNEQPLIEEWSEEQLKEEFLTLVADGEMPDVAARKLKKTATWFRRRRNPKGQNYDKDFTERYEEVMSPGGEFEHAISERYEGALMDAAQTGNVRAIEKVLMAYHPRYSFLRPAAFAGDTYNVDKLIQIMPGIPTHLLEQMREELVKQKELPVIER